MRLWQWQCWELILLNMLHVLWKAFTGSTKHIWRHNMGQQSKKSVHSEGEMIIAKDKASSCCQQCSPLCCQESVCFLRAYRNPWVYIVWSAARQFCFHFRTSELTLQCFISLDLPTVRCCLGPKWSSRNSSLLQSPTSVKSLPMTNCWGQKDCDSWHGAGQAA